MKSILPQNIRNNLAILYYYFTRKVYGRGYERYKQDLINKIIHKKKIYPITYIDERIVEIPWVINELKGLKGYLLDAGSTLNFKYILKNLTHFKKIFITTLYPENIYFNNLNISYTYEDLSSLSFKNEYFDVVTCISTLEHIGFNNEIYNYGKFKFNSKNKTKLITVLNNLKRVLKKNGTLLITIPYGKRGIYKNMQQFDDKELKQIINQLKTKKKEITYYKNYNQKWKKVSKDECSNVEPNVKKIEKQKIVLSCNSVALIKLIK